MDFHGKITDKIQHGWKIPRTQWRVLARKVTDFNGPFSSQPFDDTEGYPINIHKPSRININKYHRIQPNIPAPQFVSGLAIIHVTGIFHDHPAGRPSSSQHFARFVADHLPPRKKKAGDKTKPWLCSICLFIGIYLLVI